MSKIAIALCGIYMLTSNIVEASYINNNKNNNAALKSIEETNSFTFSTILNNEYINSINKALNEDTEVVETLMPNGQVVEDYSRVRKEPNYDSEVINLLRTGMTFEILAKHDNWLKIKIGEDEGFIHSSLIEQYEEVPPHEVYSEPEPVDIVSSEYIDGTPHYNPYNLRELSNLSINQISKMLEGSALQTLARAYYYAEKEYNVNAIFLMSLNSEESGHGRSALAINYNNIGGVKSESGGWRYFSDWGESLNYIANLIDKHYLSPDGLYYNGPSIWNVNMKYCEGTQWAINLNEIANNFLSKS